ncbi:phage antirepressor KilAC domain-containing protein [Pseudomonas neustonica]|uniref:phage antirepressor KilAC domain-containing protein n=1 Tax=Pseudomonas neustonica TaxID=2487346 RepID=UPI003F482E77
MTNDTMLSNTQPVLTMSSIEIAELLEVRHDNVRRTIQRLVLKKVIALPPMEEKPATGGRPSLYYELCKRDSYVVVAQLSPEFTAKLVDRWQELEQQAAAPAIPRTLPEALRLAADLAEQNNGLRLVVQQQAPQVEALGRIATAKGTLCLTDAAKHFGVQRKLLLAYMRENRWIYRREGSAHWLGYQPRLSAGLLEHKVTVLGTEEDGEQRLASQVRVTPKGLTVLAQKLGGQTNGR